MSIKDERYGQLSMDSQHSVMSGTVSVATRGLLSVSPPASPEDSFDMKSQTGHKDDDMVSISDISDNTNYINTIELGSLHSRLYGYINKFNKFV